MEIRSLQLNSRKRGISEMVSYVILVVISIAISLVVFNFLEVYVPDENPECEDNINLIINEYSCFESQLNLTLENKGFFATDAVYIRFAERNRTVRQLVNENTFFAHSGPAYDQGLLPGQIWNNEYNLSSIFNSSINPGDYALEIEPAMFIDQDRVALCAEALIVQNIECHNSSSVLQGSEEEIFFMGCEDPGAENLLWYEDPSSTTTTADQFECISESLSQNYEEPVSARTGTHLLSFNGSISPEQAYWNRDIGLQGYKNLELTFYVKYQGTEGNDNFELWFWNASDEWENLFVEDPLEHTIPSNATSWMLRNLSLPDSAATSDFKLQVRWITTAGDEHMMIDDLKIAGNFA